MQFSDASLDPFKGSLRCRLDHTNVKHIPTRVVKTTKGDNNKYCQMHYWATKKKQFGDLMRCEACEVNLCVDCYSIFHEESSIVAKKKSIFG